MNESSKKNIIHALNIIKTTCNKSENCDVCPFGTKDNVCLIREMTPGAWVINNNTAVWRGLLE